MSDAIIFEARVQAQDAFTECLMDGRAHSFIVFFGGQLLTPKMFGGI